VLSDHERRVLREYEGQFEAEDPEFACSFSSRQQPLSHARLGTGGKCALAVALLLSALLLATGQAPGAVTLAVTTGVTWFVWWCSETFSPPVDRKPVRPDKDGR
jgi:hypothetical protein